MVVLYEAAALLLEKTMEKERYIERLQQAMSQDYSAEYINVCVEYAARLFERELPVIFDADHLFRVLKMYNIKQDSYQEFVIAGKRGKRRIISAPSKNLKMRQRWILDHILYKIPVAQCCEGFRKNHSIFTNAKKHIGYQQSLNMDIKDFFPSITRDKVFWVFYEMGYSKDAAGCFAELCCHEEKLPQGAPTSPYLANIVCRGMDRQLMEFAEKHGLVYTRYADDMSFSGDCELSELGEEIAAIISEHGFAVNPEKTRIYKGNKRKLITGIIVKEDGLSVPRDFKRKLRQEIYYCKKFGAAGHLENTKSEKMVNFREYLYGKAFYIKMVEPVTGQKFLNELNEIQWD